MRAPFLLILLAPLMLAASSCSARSRAVRSWNDAVAALAAGDVQAAEIAAEKAAARGGREFAAQRDFLLALTALKRSAAAEARAGIPGAAVSAYARALAAAQEARDLGQRAIRAEPEDWPAARRNLERTLAQIVRLEALHDAALRDPSAARLPPPPPESAGHERLLERLGKQEEQKRIMRRGAAELPSAAVEQDW